MRALHTAATGMMAQELNVQVISNNIANMSTTGFKRQRAEFQDLLYQQIRLAGATQAEGAQVPVELQIGYGTRPVATQRIFSQGTVTPAQLAQQQSAVQDNSSPAVSQATRHSSPIRAATVSSSSGSSQPSAARSATGVPA